ncbi:MAG TPA: WbqC family protein [Moheibacter sp.]|nr:WbqC family protein [Moheibacter sp.]
MRIAIMQPYIFPYIGYFQMVNAVDKFVFYDDVNFIKKGWINRNRILVNGQDCMLTVPLLKASQNNLILESYLRKDTYGEWKDKLLQTLELNYKKASHFEEIFPLLKTFFEADYDTISEMAIESVKSVSRYLGLNTEFILSSETYENKGMERQERLIDICKIEKANHYINALGGQELYKKEDFKKEGIQLDFIKTQPITYKQFNNEFVPWLSIIDVLMFNSKEEIAEMLNKYELV